jgi:hypothetical protein
VSETLQLEEPVTVHDEPKLLVEWSSPWHEFIGSIGPALARSERRLAGEAPFGLIPLRIMLPSYFLEALLIFAAIAIQVKVAALRPFVAPRFSSHDVIYYSGDELPRTEDLGGVEAGASGRAGGNEARHRTQTIKIARGGSLVPKVVDAPNLRIPASTDAVANLLAIRPDPGPPPSEGLHSNRTVQSLSPAPIAPAPNVIRDYTRNGIQLDSVIAPAPSVSRDRSLTAPNLNAILIPPAPKVSSEHTLVAPALDPAVIAPAPSVSRDRMLNSPSLHAAVVAPAPSAAHGQTRSTPALAANVIPPAPNGVNRETPGSPVRMNNVAVIPPPVSAPERASARNPKLALPSPAVVAPPPSADVSQDRLRLASGIPDPSKTVVPPPPTQPASGSFMSSLMGKIFGASEVVPPPPAVPANGASSSSGTSLTANVVPPPPSVGATTAGGATHGARGGMGTSLGANVVAPPPSVGVSGGTGTRTGAASAGPTPGPASVVPPPPSLAGAGGGTGDTGGGAGAPGGRLLANNIVPPPPSLGGGSASAGSGSGRKAAGLGVPLDAGAGLAQPSSGGSGANAGAVISSEPGSQVGLPRVGGTGSLALSPSGGDKPGLGGAAGGTSIGRGNGPGSGLNGAGTGAGKSGPARGSDPAARDGISPAAGPGGAGNVPSGTPAVRGVDISGGSSEVTIPAFGSDPSGSDPQVPGHSPAKQRQQLGVTIVATASSGGAFEPYKNLLRGEKYTTYFDTSLGTVVMEFADEAASGHPYGATLVAPTAVRTDLGEGLPHARMVITCTLDVSGNLKNVRVLEAGPAEMTAKVLASLRSWKFQPAMRGNQAVEVTAIVGFGVNTNDRF